MKWCCTFLLCMVSLLLLPSSASGQGSIEGTVRDSLENAPLPGAHVQLTGTAFGGATDGAGHFLIKGIAPGSYTLRVSYIGYRTRLYPVTVAEGKSTVRNAMLDIDAIEGETVVVTAQAIGQAAAINRQLTSSTITNVVSSEKIMELPDANAAESVGRLPGISIQRQGGEGSKVVIRGLSPTYNAITIGGDRIPATDLDDRSVDLSMIAPEILAGIEVTKALTPDKDADALGGTVDFQLATAAPGGYTLNVRAQSGYNHERSELGEYRGRVVMSDRLFDQRFGILIAGNLERTQRGSDQFNAAYALAREKRPGEEFAPITTTQVTFEHTRDIRRRFGFSAMLDYEFPFGKIMMNNLLSRMDRNEVIQSRRFDMSGSNKMKYYLRERERQIDILTNSLAGKHDLSLLSLNWRLSRNVSTTRYPFNSRFQFEEPNAFNTAAIPAIATPGDIIRNARNRTDLAYLYDGEVEPERSYERDLTAQMDVEVPYTVADWIVGKVKAGLKVREKLRERDRSYATSRLDKTDAQYPQYHSQYGTPGFTFVRMPGTGYAAMSNYVDNGFDPGTFLDGEYEYGTGLNTGELHYFLTHYLYDQVYRFSLQRDLDDYEITDVLRAGYAMTQIDVGSFLMIMPGARYERTSMDAVGRVGVVNTPEDEGLLDNEQVRDTAATVTYGEWFPMLHVRVRPTEWCDLRVAYTKSISYPRLDYVIPAKKIRASTVTVEYGNPHLAPQLATNYDGYLSFYGNRIGLLTLGGFYKKIENLIYVRSGHVILDPVKEGVEQNLRGYSIIRPENNPFTTEVYGFECEWQTSFKWLPQPFDGIVVNVNYSHIWSETKFPRSFVRQDRIPTPPFLLTSVVDTFRTGPMPDQASDIANVSIGYDVGNFSGRVSMLVQGKTLTFVGVREELDGYTDTFTRWDLSLKYDLVKNVSVFANLNNFTNAPDQSFMQTARYATGREYYGWTADLGVTVKF